LMKLNIEALLASGRRLDAKAALAEFDAGHDASANLHG